VESDISSGSMGVWTPVDDFTFMPVIFHFLNQKHELLPCVISPSLVAYDEYCDIFGADIDETFSQLYE
jgi:hypothetical protein